MPKKLPMKYVVGYTAQIRYKKIGKWEEDRAKDGIQPYFDTWEEAWKYMLERAVRAKEGAEKELASAKRHLARVSAMRPKGA
jgi:hypothetical protein